MRQRGTYRAADLLGARFGRRTVCAVAEPGSDGRQRVMARCDCGLTHRIELRRLIGGERHACKTCELSARTQHGSARRGAVSPEWNAWARLKGRCLNVKCKDYPDYGGRGITVSSRWLESFAAFLADVGPRPSPQHSIDRIDNSGNYEPGNVRWATSIEQANNRRPRRKETRPRRARRVQVSMTQVL